jgi:hypothetical protein
MVQYFAVYSSLQTSPMQVMCCSDRVVFFAFCLFFFYLISYSGQKSIYILIIQEKSHLFYFKTFQIEDILILHSYGYILTEIILNDLYS